METVKKNYLRFSLILILCLLVRMLPFRAPNVEPILAATMPMSRAYGAFMGLSFAVLSILLYNLLTGTMGIHTLFTAGAYGLLGFWASRYFRKEKTNRRWSYVRFAIVGTLLFDALTGLTVGPLLFQQPFMSALVGQIPFTALHLAGNITFAFFLSPIIYSLLIKKRRREKQIIISTLNPKTI